MRLIDRQRKWEGEDVVRILKEGLYYIPSGHRPYPPKRVYL